MPKEFLNPLTIRDNAIRLSQDIIADGFIPSIIYVSLRGGATFGNVISECFKLFTKEPHAVLYAAVVAHSYNTFSADEIKIDGWTYPPEFIRPSDKVMLIDDIFDSGKTMNFIANEIMKQGVLREKLKVVVHDYKIREFAPNNDPIKPDYYCRKLVSETPEQDDWIHYLSHELAGLTEAEINQQYPKDVAVHVKKMLNLSS